MAIEDLNSLSNLFESSIIDTLSFIKSETKSHPLIEEEFFSAEIDFSARKWILHAKRRINILAWSELTKIFDRVQVGNLVNNIASNGGLHGFLNPNETESPIRPEFTELQQYTKEIFKQFLSTYIYAYGASYTHSKFLKIFREWVQFITGVDRGTRIVVLNQFNLIGVNQITIGEHKIRRLTEEEILALLLVKGYNQESTGIGFGNMKDGMTGELTPEYCIEYGGNPLEDETELFGNRIYALSELRKIIVSSSLRFFKDLRLSTGTELQLAPAFLKHTMPFHSAYHSLLDTIYQNESGYSISRREVASLSRFSKSLFRIDLKKWRALLVSLRRYGYYQQKSDVEDRIIDLIVALEAMMGIDLNFGEISYKIALRCAYLIGSVEGSTTEVFDVIDLAYAVRSRIVHGDDDPMKVKKEQRRKYNIENIYILQERLTHYVRLVVKTMIESVAEQQTSINPKKAHELVVKKIDQEIIS